ELRQMLGQIIRRRGITGLLGTVTLLVFASQLFAAIRLVLNDVFGFTQGRGFIHDTLKNLFLLFVMGVFFIASILITDLVGWLKILLMVPIGMPPEWIRSTFLAVGLACDTGLFFVAYRYCSHQAVPVRPALAGAILASVLWETAKQLFRWYIST